MALHHYQVWPSTWKDRRYGSGWEATYSPFRRQHSARRISLRLLSDRQPWSRCSCVLENSRWCHSWAWHISVKSGWTCTTLLSHFSQVVLLASVAVNCNDALLLEKVAPVAKVQRLAVASVRTAVKVRGEDVFINTNGEMVGRACRVFRMSSIAACPYPFRWLLFGLR